MNAICDNIKMLKLIKNNLFLKSLCPERALTRHAFKRVVLNEKRRIASAKCNSHSLSLSGVYVPY